VILISQLKKKKFILSTGMFGTGIDQSILLTRSEKKSLDSLEKSSTNGKTNWKLSIKHKKNVFKVSEKLFMKYTVVSISSNKILIVSTIHWEIILTLTLFTRGHQRQSLIHSQ
jgi:hypothetical protein